MKSARTVASSTSAHMAFCNCARTAALSSRCSLSLRSSGASGVRLPAAAVEARAAAASLPCVALDCFLPPGEVDAVNADDSPCLPGTAALAIAAASVPAAPRVLVIRRFFLTTVSVAPALAGRTAVVSAGRVPRAPASRAGRAAFRKDSTAVAASRRLVTAFAGSSTALMDAAAASVAATTVARAALARGRRLTSWWLRRPLVPVRCAVATFVRSGAFLRTVSRLPGWGLVAELDPALGTCWTSSPEAGSGL
mmetsp:Transcript_86480/g.253110  ORF Transcript_86480/g.253110 Transcript_86480/m.253110 type:complete len:252 (+) Transcript_86480:165-920(+)